MYLCYSFVAMIKCQRKATQEMSPGVQVTAHHSSVVMAAGYWRKWSCYVHLWKAETVNTRMLVFHLLSPPLCRPGTPT